MNRPTVIELRAEQEPLNKQRRDSKLTQEQRDAATALWKASIDLQTLIENDGREVKLLAAEGRRAKALAAWDAVKPT